MHTGVSDSGTDCEAVARGYLLPVWG
jgi:hypothetical protein